MKRKKTSLDEHDGRPVIWTRAEAGHAMPSKPLFTFFAREQSVRRLFRGQEFPQVVWWLDQGGKIRNTLTSVVRNKHDCISTPTAVGLTRWSMMRSNRERPWAVWESPSELAWWAQQTSKWPTKRAPTNRSWPPQMPRVC